MTLAGPGGTFTLAELRNPGHCPSCHDWPLRLWQFTPAGSTRTITVGCEACASSAGLELEEQA